MNFNDLFIYNYIFPFFIITTVYTTSFLYFKIIDLNRVYKQLENLNNLNNSKSIENDNNSLITEDINDTLNIFNNLIDTDIVLRNIIDEERELENKISEFQILDNNLNEIKSKMELNNIDTHSIKIIEHLSSITIYNKNDKAMIKCVDNILSKKGFHDVEHFASKYGMRLKNVPSIDTISDILSKHDVELFLTIVDSVCTNI